VALYREQYQPTQQGLIGMTLNQDWAEPLDPHNPADVAAAQRKNEFQMGWFADPMVFGDYPDSMKQYVGDRLPAFTLAQQMRIKGSIDFFAFNHYTTKYFSPAEDEGVAEGTAVSVGADSGPPSNWTAGPVKWGGWSDDMRVKESTYDRTGKIVGLPAASKWLHVVPWGFYNVLMWNYRRYQPKIIFITENGCDVPGENDMPMEVALDDQFR
jgi:beta-glucosidase